MLIIDEHLETEIINYTYELITHDASRSTILDWVANEYGEDAVEIAEAVLDEEDYMSEE
jgi:hypothetical protein